LDRPAAEAERPAYHHGDLRRTLFDAAIALIEEQQNWDFSLRELARRAGVSHNAPYSHFASKSELLAALATAGFEMLSEVMAQAAAAAPGPDAAYTAVGEAYVRFGRAHPGHYRLMFRSASISMDNSATEPLMRAAHAAKRVMSNVVLEGARAGVFAIDPEDQAAIELAVLGCWSSGHGLTMLFLDKMLGEVSASQPERVISKIVRAELEGLRRR